MLGMKLKKVISNKILPYIENLKKVLINH